MLLKYLIFTFTFICAILSIYSIISNRKQEKYKVNKEIPPNIHGNFEVKHNVVLQRYTGDIHNLDNIHVVPNKYTFIQKDRFVKLILDDDEHTYDAAYGVWTENYDKNLKFNGWKLTITTNENNITKRSNIKELQVTKMDNNKVLEFTTLIFQPSTPYELKNKIMKTGHGVGNRIN